MNKINRFNPHRRHALKLFTGVSTGLLAGIPVVQSAYADQSTTHSNIIDCKLIIRQDIARAHMLIQNPTANAITATSFNTPVIMIDGNPFNLAGAYNQTVVIPANDRVMIRLDAAASKKGLVSSNLVNLSTNTQYLPLGTQVVSLSARVKHGVATLLRNGTLLTA